MAAEAQASRRCETCQVSLAPILDFLFGAEPERRSSGEVQANVDAWINRVHQRALGEEGMYERVQVEDILASIANNVDKSSDPTQQSSSECVHWLGRICSKHNVDHAGMLLTTPGQPAHKSYSFVNRVLVLLFASELVWDECKKLPQGQPLQMRCGNQMCVNISHISSSCFRPKGNSNHS
eukprot:TRINITY_DN34072_c0_g2_i2.p1 TRINITY_DN34072_c0_g2~~TRINITY_DN34072_c0_g2_i2.p1  ORF type:complete len:180 (-),score=22.08 TRINITY_DN34072_c0_g2_i2:510-1049(-)